MFFKKRPKPHTQSVKARVEKTVANYPDMLVPADSIERGLSGEALSALPPGGAHYRAYVGPPDRFDFMSLTQMALLYHMGLREHHKVLDFGCGSLRLGRLLIPLLAKAGYHGIDPNKWLIEDGFSHELGQDIRALKAPRFDHNTDFNCDVFDTKFDYIISQSIVTHTGPTEARAILNSAKACLAPGGIFLFNYISANAEARHSVNNGMPDDGWYYPECVSFTPEMMMGFVGDADLAGVSIPWFHPTSSWLACAHNADELPSAEQLQHLRGGVLRDEQFAHSLES